MVGWFIQERFGSFFKSVPFDTQELVGSHCRDLGYLTWVADGKAILSLSANHKERFIYRVPSPLCKDIRKSSYCNWDDTTWEVQTKNVRRRANFVAYSLANWSLTFLDSF